METSRSGSTTGRGRNSKLLATLNTKVFTPNPSPSASTTIAVSPGFLASMRRPIRKSCQKVDISLTQRPSERRASEKPGPPPGPRVPR
jgi:hypothetical protein